MATPPLERQHIDPRPVVGQREYSLIFEGKPKEIANAHATARELLEKAGAKVVTDDTNGLVLVYDHDRTEFAISLRIIGSSVKALQLRIRPDEVDQTNFWPPRELLGVAAETTSAHELYDGPTRLRVAPMMLGPMDARRWTDDVLFSQDRQLPIVVLTPGRYATPELSHELARDLAGIANVYVFTDAELAKNWSYSITRERGVFGGAVRIYRAGFTPDSDPTEHDLLVAGYIDRRLALGRTLAEELARRILPDRGEPIARPRSERQYAPRPIVPLAPAVRKKRPEERIQELEEHIEALEERNEELEEETRRLNAALRSQVDRLRQLEGKPQKALTRLDVVQGVPWPLENPLGFQVELGELFAADLARVARDGSLAEEVRKKMESVLRHPEEYGKDMRGARKGQRACYVARNYRLVWSVEGRKVRFVLIVSKEDPEYSPHGA